MATIIYPENPSPVADAEAIRKACQGWGTDEKAIISIFGHRNATQKKLIRRAYEELYNEDLVKRLESELSGHFEKAVYRWILDPEDRDAVILHVAIKETPIPDYRVIIEYSCIYSPEELLAVKRAYQARYKRSVEEDLAEHSAGELRKLLVALVGIYRYAGEDINARVANTEADILHSAISNKEFNNEEIVRIISTRSIPQLIATLNRYKDDYGSSITKHLRDDANAAKEYLVALRTTIRCISDPQKYYEKVIRYAINESGTDEESVTRVIVTRAEKDLKDIKELYYKRNSVTLDHALSKHTSGDYKAFLLALLGNDN
ncbi:annexin-like protein RJ4 [Nicotiana tabacum]|uniref:Annexin n=1 Tax=Nicotiana tabacum TaxID=4097 RepID=A0A1S4DJI8_TOBAC|nr:annexin-like protein RJ4 [Nicotiana tomentosiformis]XP_016513543.1 PREDICTED: annexin-like protein RJ4 [Nicotiana tabacum]